MRTNIMSDQENKNKTPEKQGVLKDYLIIFASMVVVLAGIHLARGVLGPLFLATFFTVLLIIPVNWLKSKGTPSWAALAIVVLCVALAGLSTITVVGAQLAQFARNIPQYRDQFNDVLKNYNIDVSDVIPFLKSDKEEKEEQEASEVTEEDVKQAYLNELRWREEYEQSKHDGKTLQDGRQERPIPEGSGTKEPQAAPNETRKTPIVAPVSSTTADYYASGNEQIARAMPVGPETLAVESLVDSVSDAAPSPAAQPAVDELAPAGLILPNPPSFRADDDELTQDVQNALTEAFMGNRDDDQDARDKSDDDSGAEDKKRWFQADDSDLSDYLRATRPNAVSAVDASSQELFRFLRGLAGELSYFGSNAFIVTLLVIFMLCETAKIPQKLVAALGKRRFTNSHIDSVINDIRNYMAIKTLMCGIVGVGVIVLCLVSQVQYPLLWGFVAFLLNYIPNIGSVAASIPPIVLATIDRGLVVGCVDAGALVALNCLVGYALEPRLLGDGLDLSPLIVLISLIFFGWILGPVGMFLAPPLAVIMKIIFQSFPETRWIAALMANKPPKEIVEDDSEDSVVEA